MTNTDDDDDDGGGGGGSVVWFTVPLNTHLGHVDDD